MFMIEYCIVDGCNSKIYRRKNNSRIITQLDDSLVENAIRYIASFCFLQ